MGQHLYKQKLRNCYRCKKILPLTKKYFFKSKNRNSGFMHSCKECDRQKKKKRRLQLRFEIFKRDNFTCQYCGRKSPEVELRIDHKIPKNKQGKDDKKNYITACSECNLGKSDILLTEFKKSGFN